MNKRITEILAAVREHPAKFKKFSNDSQQIDPVRRLTSILGILSSIKIPKNSTILDIGTGYGYAPVLLSALGHRVVGVESNLDKLSEGMRYWRDLGIEFDKGKKLPEVQSVERLYFLAGDARDISGLVDCPFDIVTSFYISGYMAGKGRTFRNVDKLLGEGGRLIITTEGPRRIPSLFRRSAVNLLARFHKPKNLDLVSQVELGDPDVHDRYVLTYQKSANR